MGNILIKTFTLFSSLLPALNEKNLPWIDVIHPIVVHFVIAMALGAVFFDFVDSSDSTDTIEGNILLFELPFSARVDEKFFSCIVVSSFDVVSYRVDVTDDSSDSDTPDEVATNVEAYCIIQNLICKIRLSIESRTLLTHPI